MTAGTADFCCVARRRKRCQQEKKERVTRYVQALLDSGDVYQGEYEGWYDAGQEEYVSESKAKQNDYMSEVNGKALVRTTERNYFFKLASYRESLLSFYEDRERQGMPFVLPEARKNEVVNRIKEMEDVPISRTGSVGWGTFGNCCSRVTNMIGKYFGGKLPEPLMDGNQDHSPLKISDWASQYEHHFELLDLRRAGQASLLAVREVDAYIEKTQPFRMAKEAKMEAVGTVLYNCTEALRIASVLLWPYIPNACEEFWQRIGCGHYVEALANSGRGKFGEWAEWGLLVPGTAIDKGEPLFPRYQLDNL